MSRVQIPNPKPPRQKDEIQIEYTKEATALARSEYNIFEFTRQKEAALKRMRELNVEGAARAELDAEANKKGEQDEVKSN